MKLSDAFEKLELAVDTAGSPDATHTDLKNAMQATYAVDSYVASIRSELVQQLSGQPTAFPEAVIAETSGCTLGAATKEKDRSNTLDAAIAMAEALSDGAIAPGHVDAVTRATRNLDDAATSALLGDDEALAEAASTRTIAEFDRWVKNKTRSLDTSDPEDRLAKQRSATRVRTWTDDDGMWNLKGRFDPNTGRKIAAQLDERMRTKHSEPTPDNAPKDPIERRQYLEGLAVAELILEEGARTVGGAPIFVVDATQTDGAGGPVIDWGIPVELPASVLHDVLGATDPDVVIVANGVVLHAPGQLDLGRSTRLATNEQRRALRGLYSSCAVPGCAAHYNRCKLHHVVEWEHGGLTNLDNLLPVCQHHHTLIHNDGWTIEIGPNGDITFRLPNGQVLREPRDKRGAA